MGARRLRFIRGRAARGDEHGRRQDDGIRRAAEGVGGGVMIIDKNNNLKKHEATYPDLNFLKKYFDEVEEETKQKVGIRFLTWSEHYNNWIDFVQPLYKNTSKSEQNNSITIFRFVEMGNIILWVWFSVIWGRYHTAIRELRYLFESFLQAYYLDTEHPISDILCKLEILKEIDRELIGNRLIDRLNLKQKDELKKLYQELSKYIHSSYEELKPVITEGKVASRFTFAFDQDLFDKSEEFTNRVADAVYFLILNGFPQIKDLLRKDEMTLRSLKEFDCNLTLQFLHLPNLTRYLRSGK